MFKGNKIVSAKDKRTQFERVRVLIADADSRTADLVRRVLFSFGFRNMFVADNGADALNLMRVKKIDLVITEWRMNSGDGVNFIKAVRNMQGDAQIRRDVPIIMLTAQAERDDVQRARDAGVTEFVVKPFSAKTLSHRIIQVVDSPRVFVESKGYVGPCRRRKAPIPDGVERRKPPEVKEKIGSKAKSMFASITSLIKVDSLLGADIYAPNTAISVQIGGRAEAILNDAVVAQAQANLMAAEDEFLVWARDDIAKLEEAYSEMQLRPGDAMAHHLLLSSAYSIKAQAGIFGYNLGTEIGRMLVLYLQQNPVIDSHRLIVVRKHIDTMQVIFQHKMKDADSQIGQEMIGTLEQLIAKIG